MNAVLSGVLITSVICLSIVAIVVMDNVKNYKLQKEKIKADAMVKVEEINAKNRLELEQLMVSNSGSSGHTQADAGVFTTDDRSIKEKVNG